ncbi:tRNA (N6-threonylcarbamoyladenosine(37)-N6)-methyltransferase TrmO [Hominifimenecus sp. rT4P-3]|uniref:tRNA (N6-threonylcarbamoyladenosine(37)-N6)-methyltransferase TrmO n=1 Tax=Hominifimenecus sp. rT4P-3 TaxID=3242979 RepID=UPI003DA5894F
MALLQPMKIVARIRSDFPTKFGIPRQSGLVHELKSKIVFEPEFRNVDAVRGIEDFTYLWLIWEFSEAVRDTWAPTVRPPRLGGNRRMGVFATRSPFRPNPIGLSSVRLERVEIDPRLGPVLHISGADLMDNTPILDIKPYLPFVDSHPEAAGGFAESTKDYRLLVEFPEQLLALVPEERRDALQGVLASDPRPSYQNDPERVYGFGFAGLEIRFTVQDGVLTVRQVEPATEK